MSDRTTIKNALKDIPGLGSISGTWPTAKSKFPAIVVGLVSRKNTDRRDDQAYLVESEYYVRIFAYDSDVVDDLFDAVKTRMEAIGWELTYSFEQNVEGALQMICRYSKTSPIV
jgi:hypothetical protein